MMKFEKLITTFVDVMEAADYSILMVKKLDAHTYVVKLRDDEDQAFDYVRGVARFIEKYCKRISAEYRRGTDVGYDDDTMTVVFRKA